MLNGAAPTVCPACGRPWRAEAPCVCLEPAPVVSLWARLWRWLTAPWRPPEPRVIYDAEIPRPTPPRPRVGKSTVSVLRAQDFTPPE